MKLRSLAAVAGVALVVSIGAGYVPALREAKAIEGFVTVGGVPSAGMSVAIHGAGAEARALTDERGRYRLDVPSAGRYTLIVGTSHTMPSRTFVTSLDGARRFVQIDLPAQRLQLAFVQTDGALVTTHVNVRWEGPLREVDSTSGAGFASRRDGGKTSVVGWREGTYLVTAWTKEGLWGEANVSVGEAANEELAITLQRSVSLVRVTNGNGQGLEAKVAAPGRSFSSDADGNVLLNAVGSEEPLVVTAAGYEARCVIRRPGAGAGTVALQPSGPSIELDLVDAERIVGALSSNNSDCDIPLAMIASRATRTETATTVTLNGAPLASQFVLGELRVPLANGGRVKAGALSSRVDSCGRMPLSAARVPRSHSD